MRTFLFLCLLLCGTVFSQTAVPYRVGNKFGLADAATNKLLIPAQYDVIDPEIWRDRPVYFIAYTLADSSARSTLIYNNRIILENQPYKDYYLDNDLFIGHAYTPRKTKYWDEKAFSESCQLFTLSGKPVLDGSFSHVGVFSEPETFDHLNEVLVLTIDSTEKCYSLLVYDKRQERIARTYVDRATHFERQWREEDASPHPIVAFVYKDPAGTLQHLKIWAEKDVLLSEQVPYVKPVSTRDEDFYDDGFDMPMERYGSDRVPPPPTERNKVAIDGSKYYFTKKVQRITFTNDGFDSDYARFIIVNGKKGLKLTHNGQVIVPARYDEVLEADFPDPDNGGYVLRTGSKYGLFIYKEPKNMLIEPIFTKVPLVEEADYFGTGAPLIRLYDAQGNFFCFANRQGKLFYNGQ